MATRAVKEISQKFSQYHYGHLLVEKAPMQNDTILDWGSDMVNPPKIGMLIDKVKY